MCPLGCTSNVHIEARLALCRDAQKRQLVAFIGGLDLCDGRYDTAEHWLFHTLKTVHSEDFHQACYAGGSIKQGGEGSLLPAPYDCGIMTCLVWLLLQPLTPGHHSHARELDAGHTLTT